MMRWWQIISVVAVLSAGARADAATDPCERVRGFILQEILCAETLAHYQSAWGDPVEVFTDPRFVNQVDVLLYRDTKEGAGLASGDWIMATRGLTGRSMEVPPGLPKELALAEMMIVLPSDWFGSDEPDFRAAEKDPDLMCPLIALHQTAYYFLRTRNLATKFATYTYNGSLCPDDQIEAVLIWHPMYLAPKDWTRKTEKGFVNFYQLVPIYMSEIEAATKSGDVGGYLGSLYRNHLGEILSFHPDRKPMDE